MSQSNRRINSRKKEIVANSKSCSASKQAVAEISHHDTVTSQHADLDYATMSTADIMNLILEKTDPEIDRMVRVVLSRIPHELRDAVEADKRSRSLVISGLPEADPSLPPSEKQRDLESKVSEVLDVVDVECRPIEVYRMGTRSNSSPRLVKLVLPSKSHWITALANAHRLRREGFANVYIRKSMTLEERKREFELRQECRERNRDLKTRAWVVYRGELRQVQDLPNVQVKGNSSLRQEHTQA